MAKKCRPKDLYLDVTCKDAHVHPKQPVPKCDHGKLAQVDELRHPNTAARVYYTYDDCCVSNHL